MIIMAKKATSKKTEVVELKPIQVAEFDFTIRGTSSLIVQQFSEKNRGAIEDKQGQKAKGAREKRNPNAEYLAAHYCMPGTGKAGDKKTKYGVPAAGLKNCAVTACRFVDGMQMTFARGAFHVLEDAGGLVVVKYKATNMRTDTVRLPNGNLDLRYRPEFHDWSIRVRIRYNKTAISPEQIVNLFNNAGFGVGLCEWRPEKNGSHGMFEVATK